MTRTYHPVQPRPDTGFGFEEIMRNPDYTRFTDWYRRSSFFAGRAPIEDVFSQPYAVEAGIEDFDEAA